VQIIACIEDPPVIGQILSHLALDCPNLKRQILPTARAPP
jgi:hypothetical protein